MNSFLTILSQIQAENLGLFISIGQNLLKGIATILIVWFGVTTALESSSFGGGFKFDRFIRLIFLISLCFFMVNKYSSFVDTITGMGDWLTLKISKNVDISLVNALVTYYKLPDFSLEQLLKIGEMVALIVVWFLSVVYRAITFIVIAYGYLARLILVLVGPLFIPFYLVQDLRWLFIGWFKALIQYTFYPVIAYLFVYVMQLFFISSKIYEQHSIVDLVKSFPFIVTVIGVGIYFTSKIPKLVNHIFSGISGL